MCRTSPALCEDVKSHLWICSLCTHQHLHHQSPVCQAPEDCRQHHPPWAYCWGGKGLPTDGRLTIWWHGVTTTTTWSLTLTRQWSWLRMPGGRPEWLCSPSASWETWSTRISSWSWTSALSSKRANRQFASSEGARLHLHHRVHPHLLYLSLSLCNTAAVTTKNKSRLH